MDEASTQRCPRSPLLWLTPSSVSEPGFFFFLDAFYRCTNKQKKKTVTANGDLVLAFIFLCDC